MAKLRVKCASCPKMFWSPVMKIKNPAEGKILVPTQQNCQRCRNIATMIKQHRGMRALKLGKENKFTKIEITPEYIRQELVKAENKRRREAMRKEQAKKVSLETKKRKPHFDPEEYDVTEEEE